MIELEGGFFLLDFSLLPKTLVPAWFDIQFGSILNPSGAHSGSILEDFSSIWHPLGEAFWLHLAPLDAKWRRRPRWPRNINDFIWIWSHFGFHLGSMFPKVRYFCNEKIIDFPIDFGSHFGIILGTLLSINFNKKRSWSEKGDFVKISVSCRRELDFRGSDPPESTQRRSRTPPKKYYIVNKSLDRVLKTLGPQGGSKKASTSHRKRHQHLLRFFLDFRPSQEAPVRESRG